MSILTPRNNMNMNTGVNKLEKDNGITSLTTMETMITLLQDKVDHSTLENASQLPPHTLPNTLTTNPRQLNPPIPNPMKGSHNLKDLRSNIPPKGNEKNK